MLLRNPIIPGVDYRNLYGALPEEKMVPSNVDGILHVEKTNQFLVKEIKQPGERMGWGQVRLLKGFSLLPNFTVVVVEIDGMKTPMGHYDFNPIRWRWFKNGEGTAYKKCNLEMYTRWYRDWYEAVLTEPEALLTLGS